MAHILLIDDDQPLRRAMRLMLEKSGYAVSEAEDGRAGLAAYKKQTADLVITDLIMPEMEGMETIRALRKLNPVLKIIAITGGGRGASDGYLQMARQFGAAHAMAKPFELSALCAVVGQLLRVDGAAPAAPIAND